MQSTRLHMWTHLCFRSSWMPVTSWWTRQRAFRHGLCASRTAKTTLAGDPGRAPISFKGELRWTPRSTMVRVPRPAVPCNCSSSATFLVLTPSSSSRVRNPMGRPRASLALIGVSLGGDGAKALEQLATSTLGGCGTGYPFQSRILTSIPFVAPVSRCGGLFLGRTQSPSLSRQRTKGAPSHKRSNLCPTTSESRSA